MTHTPTVTEAGFTTLQRGANVVDVRDMRAALHGLSLSPCKKRCVHSLSRNGAARPANSVCGPGRESGCIEAGETAPSASHKSERRLQSFQDQDDGPRPDADDVQDDEDWKDKHYDLVDNCDFVALTHAVPTSSQPPPKSRASPSRLVLSSSNQIVSISSIRISFHPTKCNPISTNPTNDLLYPCLTAPGTLMLRLPLPQDMSSDSDASCDSSFLQRLQRCSRVLLDPAIGQLPLVHADTCCSSASSFFSSQVSPRPHKKIDVASHVVIH